MAKLNIEKLAGRVGDYKNTIKHAKQVEEKADTIIDIKIEYKQQPKKIINMLLKESDCTRLNSLAYTLNMPKSTLFIELIKFATDIINTSPSLLKSEIEAIIYCENDSMKGRKVTYSIPHTIVDMVDSIKNNIQGYMYDIMTAVINLYIVENQIIMINAPQKEYKSKTYNLIRSIGRHDKSNTRIK